MIGIPITIGPIILSSGGSPGIRFAINIKPYANTGKTKMELENLISIGFVFASKILYRR